MKVKVSLKSSDIEKAGLRKLDDIIVKEYAKEWQPTADRLWNCGHFTQKGYVNFAKDEEKAAL